MGLSGHKHTFYEHTHAQHTNMHRVESLNIAYECRLNGSGKRFI